jgi:hypothetical protein
VTVAQMGQEVKLTQTILKALDMVEHFALTNRALLAPEVALCRGGARLIAHRPLIAPQSRSYVVSNAYKALDALSCFSRLKVHLGTF